MSAGSPGGGSRKTPLPTPAPRSFVDPAGVHVEDLGALRGRGAHGVAALSVRRAVTFTMIYLIVAGLGIFSLTRLRLDMYPELTFPVLGVITQYVGAGPKDVEEMISRRIEEAVSSVKGVKQVSSTSKFGISVVIVQFEWGTDLEMRELDIRKSVGFVESILPDDATEPMIFAFDTSMQPIIFISIAGPFDQMQLREISEEQLEPRLERLPGVASALTMGGLKRQVQVRLKPDRLQAFGLSPQQVVGALRGENLTLPGGSLVQAGREFPVETQAHFENVEQIREVVVGVRGMVPVHLRDVAEVVDGQQEVTRIVRNEGKPGVMLMIRKQSDANTVQTVRAVRAALPQIQTTLPKGLKITPVFDQAEIIEQSLGNLSNSALQAFVLTALVLLFFLLNVRTSLIVALSIPVSILATFAAMDAAGITLNVISMAGLALAVGMLVDNSIVVIENIFRHHELGLSPAAAAVRGAGEVTLAISASTLTTVAVFAPVLFVPGIAGLMFRDMALTICFSLTLSLVVALTLVPLAASRLLARRERVLLGAGGEESRSAGSLPDLAVTPAESALHGESVVGAAAATAAGRGKLVHTLLGLQEGMARGYLFLLRKALDHRLVTLTLAAAALVLAGYLGTRIDIEFMAKTDQAMITLQLKAAVGSSMAEMDRLMRQVEQTIQEAVPERLSSSVDFGQGEGFMALFSEGQHSATVRLKLTRMEERKRREQEIAEDLRTRLSKIPGLKVTVMQPQMGSAAGDLVIELYGHDLQTARTVGRKLVELAKGTPGTADVDFSLEEGTPEFQIHLDRHRLAALGLNAMTVAATVSTLLQGSIASQYRERGNEYEILVRADRSFRSDVRNLEEMALTTPTGRVVPLSSVATVRTELGPMAIARKNQQRLAQVTMTVPGKNLGAVTAELEERLRRVVLPEGFTTRIAGTAEDMQESFSYLDIALLVAILLVYMVMASQFESLLHPFVIIFSVPLAAVGVMLALWSTDTSMGVTAIIGLIMLAGIVVNNAIVLVDFINQLKAEGLATRPAIEQAGRLRLRPILMTAATTVLGMVPLALELGSGAELWSPLARTVIGGLTASTFLTLLVVPVIYSLVEGGRDRFRRFLARRDERLVQRAAARG